MHNKYNVALQEDGSLFMGADGFDEKGKPFWLSPEGERNFTSKRTPISHPYSYDPIILFTNTEVKASNTVYSDRLFQWNSDKHDKLCTEYFGNRGQVWRDRAPESIQSFLRAYIADQSIALVRIVEYCNPSNGYPCWRFDYGRIGDGESGTSTGRSSG